MTNPRLEDHAVGVELQMTELAEQIERALIQGRADDAARLRVEHDRLQDDLVRTADAIAEGRWDLPGTARSACAQSAGCRSYPAVGRTGGGPAI